MNTNNEIEFRELGYYKIDFSFKIKNYVNVDTYAEFEIEKNNFAINTFYE